MKDEELDPNWTSGELSVLRSAELDLPPQGATERALTALGMSAALGVGAATAAASEVVAAKAAIAGGALTSSAWIKWLGLALVAGGAASGVFFARRELPPRAPNDVPSVTSARARASVAPSALTADLDRGGLPSPLTGAVAPVSSNRAPAAPSRTTASTEKTSFTQEVQAIDEARQRLRHGDARGALDTLARYDELVKGRGSLRAEATVMRIEALQASGDTSRAMALAQRFLSKNPRSPYAEYLRHLLPLPD